MNIVQEEIQSIIDENNIAQEQFSEFLQDKNTMVSELHIEDRLHGELDLSILEQNGFNNVTSLIFEEGELIRIQNIPDHLEKLVCPYNLLTELTDLPTSLNYLDIQGNYISELDMLSVPNLTYLNINENQITTLEPLPKKMESLFANNNKLQSLDFQDVKNIRTGRVSPDILKTIVIESYGSKTPLTQLSNINNLDNMTLNVNIWDSSLVKVIEKSILDSNLGVTPQTDGTNVILKFPELTAERRKELVKIISEISEKFKISIRGIRRKFLDEIKNLEKEKSISIDESKKFQDEIQKLTDSSTNEIEKLSTIKEAEILKV